MIRSRQQSGGRYLAGFVMGSAIVYLAVTSVIALMAWRDSEPRWLLTNYLELGVAPSLVAFWLAKRAWATRPLPSAGLCALGLVVLLVAMTLWRAFVVSF